MAGENDTSEWVKQPPDPDLEQDLGYELDSWDVTNTHCRGEEHLVFLPSSNRIRRNSEFIVAHPDDVCDLFDQI